MPERLVWRGAMWWLTGYSNGLAGEELSNPDMLDELYRQDYEEGVAAGEEVRHARAGASVAHA